MNIQTERLADHTARLTVEIDNERLEQAKQQAARKISGRVNLPGFRKGKAPYRVLVNYVGESYILQEAVDLISNDIYKEALQDSDIDPYGPGALEDVQVEGTPTLKFIVPMQPTITLNDYRTVRLPYQPPTVTDEDVNGALKQLQEREALVEESQQPVALGNRVVVDIHSHVVHDDPADEAVEERAAESLADAPPVQTEDALDLAQAPSSEANTVDGDDVADELDLAGEDAHDHDHNHAHTDDDTFIHEHAAPITLDADGEPVPGFSDALVGANVGETKAFTLTIPDDAEKFDNFAGKQVHFHVTVSKVEVLTLPTLNDDLAARLTADEEKPLSLLELRIRVRENLERQTTQQYENDYAGQALDAVVAQAAVSFPEAMVADEVEGMLNQMDQALRQQRMTLDDYKKILNKTDEDLYDEYRPTAEQRVKRALVMREVMNAEGIAAENADVEAEVERMIDAVAEDRREQTRTMFNQRGMRSSVLENMLRERVNVRLSAIAKGDPLPELPVDPPGTAEETSPEAPEQAPNDEANSEPSDADNDAETTVLPTITAQPSTADEPGTGA